MFDENKFDENKFKVINLNYLKELSGGDSQFIKEMLEIFLANYPKYMKKLTTGIEVKEWVEIRKMAHKIKPTLAYIGLDELIPEFQQVEEWALANTNYESIVTKINTLNATCKLALEEVETAVKEL